MQPLCFAVLPQNSVLGPLLFTLYTPLSSLIHSHKLHHHLNADYTQVYISLAIADTDLSLKQLDDCLSDISGWMTNNKRRFSANKTYFIIIQTTQTKILVSSLGLSLIKATHNQTLYVILVLQLIEILISENLFL